MRFKNLFLALLLAIAILPQSFIFSESGPNTQTIEDGLEITDFG